MIWRSASGDFARFIAIYLNPSNIETLVRKKTDLCEKGESLLTKELYKCLGLKVFTNWLLLVQLIARCHPFHNTLEAAANN